MAALEITRAPSAFVGLIGKTINSVVANVVAWNETRQTRSALSQLTDHELADIGLSRSAIVEIQ